MCKVLRTLVCATAGVKLPRPLLGRGSHSEGQRRRHVLRDYVCPTPALVHGRQSPFVLITVSTLTAQRRHTSTFNPSTSAP